MLQRTYEDAAPRDRARRTSSIQLEVQRVLRATFLRAIDGTRHFTSLLPSIQHAEGPPFSFSSRSCLYKQHMVVERCRAQQASPARDSATTVRQPAFQKVPRC